MTAGVVKIDDAQYPEALRILGKDAPKHLYYKGEWPANGKAGIFENCLAVVGSRRMTSYGRQIAEKLVSQIASRGITIVSGFMYGIDATSHQAAIEVGGKTVAVMPCGIDLIHPEYQKELYQEILDNKGLVISEYEGSFLPTLWTYPRRNRIVAGLSRAVLVIEAGERSGSLITANFARKFKRKIFAVPGQIISSVSVGVNQLIKDGAQIVTSADDILKYFNTLPLPEVVLNPVKHGPNKPNSMEERIIDQLQREPMEIDFLARSLSVGSAELGKTISMMEIKGQIKEERGKYYAN